MVVDGETQLVSQAVAGVQDRLHGVHDTLSRVTSGYSGVVLDGVAGVTGVHEMSEADLGNQVKEGRKDYYDVLTTF